MKINQNGTTPCNDTALLAGHASRQNPVSDATWTLLLKQTRRFARNQIRRLSWRGEKSGILPGGYDPDSVAAEAIAEFLKGQQDELSTCDTQHSTLNAEQIQQDLRRRVHRIIDRLRHRKENRLLRNEQDLAPVLTDDGELLSRWETVPAPDAGPLEVLMHKEDCAELEKFIREFDAFLGGDPPIKKLFACYCAGETKPRVMASALDVPVGTIQALQRRLRRKLVLFLAVRSESSRGQNRCSAH